MPPPDFDDWPGDIPVWVATSWEAVKIQVLLRPWDGRCEYCGKRRPCDAHHRLLKGRLGKDDPRNLAAICRVCHDHIHGHPVEATDRGFMVDSWDDPWVIPMRLWDGRLARLDEWYGYEILEWPAEGSMLG